MKMPAPWLEALAACFPDLKVEGLGALWRRLDGPGKGGSWEGGVSAAEGFPSLRLRYRGRGKNFREWSGAAARLCGLGPAGSAGAPPSNFPWFEGVWDTRKGELASATFFGAGPSAVCRARGGQGETVVLSESPFRPELWREAGLEGVFRDFAALVPVAALISEAVREGSGPLRPRHAWALRLARPEPWPLFLRLDLAAPFAPQASQWALLLRDLPVTEVALRDDALWAYFQCE